MSGKAIGDNEESLRVEARRNEVEEGGASCGELWEDDSGMKWRRQRAWERLR